MDFLDCCWPIGGACAEEVEDVGSVWEDCTRDLDSLEVSTERRVGARLGRKGAQCRSRRRYRSGGVSVNLVYCCLFTCLQQNIQHVQLAVGQGVALGREASQKRATRSDRDGFTRAKRDSTG